MIVLPCGKLCFSTSECDNVRAVCLWYQLDLMNCCCCLDMENGEVADMQALGITESFRVKQQVLVSGSEAAEMILRVDSILRSAPRRRDPDNRPC